MDRSVAKFRKSHPDHLPVFCECYPDGGEKPRKLAIPHEKTGAEFVQLIRQRCPWAATNSKVWIKKDQGLEVPKSALVKDLDSKEYKAADDALYVQVERKGSEPIAEVPAEAKIEAKAPAKAEEIDMSKSVQEFKMTAATKDSCPIQKVITDGSDQAEKTAARARQMLKKYPDRVPVLVNQPESPGLPKIEGKLLVPRNMKPRDLRQCLAKHLKLENADIPWDKVRMLMAGDEWEEDQCMGLIYDSIVEYDDGGLHLALELGEPFDLVTMPSHIEVSDEEPPSEGEHEELESLKIALLQAKDDYHEADQMRNQEEQRADRAEQGELQALESLERAEIKVEELQEANRGYQADLEQERDERIKLEATVRSLQEDLRNKEKTLNAAQAALRGSGRENTAAQEKIHVQEEKIHVQEEKLLAMEKERDGFLRRLKSDEESILRLKDMCTKVKQKLAESEDTCAQLEEELAMGKESSLMEKGRYHTQLQENELLKSELQAMLLEKTALLDEVNAFKAKAAQKAAAKKEKEESGFNMVGWDNDGKPVSSEDMEECSTFKVEAP